MYWNSDRHILSLCEDKLVYAKLFQMILCAPKHTATRCTRINMFIRYSIIVVDPMDIGYASHYWQT